LEKKQLNERHTWLQDLIIMAVMAEIMAQGTAGVDPVVVVVADQLLD
jgi:hypothetical protein